MVGEIRDTETQKSPFRRRSLGTWYFPRCIQHGGGGDHTFAGYGRGAFPASSSLTGVMAQRLVRTLCPDSASPRLPPTKKNACWGLPMRCRHSVLSAGLPRLYSQRFSRRTAIHELIVVDATLRDLIHLRPGSWSWNVMSGNTLRASAQWH